MTVYAVVSRSGPAATGQLWESVKSADRRWLACAVLCGALFVVMEGEAIRCILKGIGYRRGPVRGLIYSASDVYFSAITPSASGGQPASAYFMVKDGVPTGAATVALLVNLIMYTVSMLVLGVAAVLAAPQLLQGLGLISRILVGVGFLVLVLLTLAFFVLLGNSGRFFALLDRFLGFLYNLRIIRNLERKRRKLVRVRRDFKVCARTMKGKTATLVKAFLWNLGQRSSQLAVPMCLFLALGGSRGMAGRVFASQCLSTIGYSCVPVPGAMGVADYLMIDGFTELLGRDGAFRLELLSRGISFYICVAASGIITVLGYCVMRNKEKRRSKE